MHGVRNPNQTQEHEPVACTATVQAARQQLSEWRDLRGFASTVARIPDGVRMLLPAEVEPDLRELVDREAECCRFLDFELRHDGRLHTLEVTSPNPEADEVIAMLVGRDLR